jgi:hypothetical protein
MYIEKIFHLRQPLNEARERLRSAGTWTASEEDALVHCAANDLEVFGHLEFKSRQGELISADIEEVLGDEPDRILFRSTHGDVELAGVIELFPIRPNLTEAVLTVEYEAPSVMQKAIERISVGIDQFLNRQLARIERARVGEAVGLCA